ncbi:MAG: class I SAM-dependent methyltransferase [Steroidobacteraceae bacterium]
MKLGAKLVLARLPVPYSAWKRLRLFQHGCMDSMGYALDVFESHAGKCGLLPMPAGRILCEIGPGDSLASALIGRCAGAAHTYLVDAGNFATLDAAAYRPLAETLRSRGWSVPDDIRFDSVPAYLDSCRATYLTDGLRSMASIPSASVDMIWSHAVLEHIRAAEFAAYARELARVTRPGSHGSHRVDLQDHLGGALNNLRFSPRTWESGWFTNSGFYTNRLQFSRVVSAFRDAGFRVETPKVDRWSALPTPRTAMDPEFQRTPDDELRISGFDMITCRPLATAS